LKSELSPLKVHGLLAGEEINRYFCRLSGKRNGLLDPVHRLKLGRACECRTASPSGCSAL